MKRILQIILCKLCPWYRHRTLYIIADATDNSVTFSHALFRRLNVMRQKQAKVYVFKVSDKYGYDKYAFCINPPIDEPTQLADIQYNKKHRCIGFESLCPTVSRIFYDYGIQADRVKLSVEPHTTRTAAAITYYQILQPNGNITAKLQKA